MKRLLLSLLAFACLNLPAHAGRIAPALEAQIEALNLSGSDEIKVLVALKNPSDVDVPALDFHLHLTGAPLAMRHRQIVDTLRDAADRSQGPILAELEARLTNGGIRGYTPYWILNGIVVKGTVDTIRELALRDDVDVIEPDLVAELIEPVAEWTVDSRGTSGLLPGIDAIEADRVWFELGITGEGALVANMDTGVDVEHPAFGARWRGHIAPVDECWRDSANNGFSVPDDFNSHGTHVMGTITGQTTADSIGVAPGALWIADNSIDQGVGSEFDNDVLGALQWFADPDGNPGTLDDVPDVVQNSWGINENFPGGYTDCDSRWWAAMDNCEASGVVLTWSAGNEGPSSQSLRSPADRADSPTNAFSVGSTIRFPPFTISGFSSRGPSGCGGPFAIKPEISAPGSDIWSALPNGGYGFKSGTSMSGPHVAGVVALMRSANPNLDVETIKTILMDTATDLGSTGEDNTYGHGFVNAYEAVLSALTGFGSIEGIVTDAVTGNPIEGVTITIDSTPQSDVSDATGFYRFVLPPETYTLNYDFFGYVPGSATLVVSPDQTTNGDFAMNPAATARLSGTVRDFNGSPVDGATIMVLATPLAPATSQPDGTYEIFLPDNQSYDVRAVKSGLGTVETLVAINGDTVQDFDLPEVAFEGYETGDFSALPWEFFPGQADWQIDTVDPFEGTYSAISGDIGSNQISTMRVDDIELAAAGSISFWYKVDAGSGDFLRFYLDGQQQDAWGGSTGWVQASYPVTAGNHSFWWRYTKDSSNTAGQDAAWVDAIAMPPLVGGAVDAPAIAALPNTFELGRAFPNPSANDTAILFSVPAGAANVDLSLYDVTGRRIRTLVSGSQPTGRHVANWDGVDSQGNRVAAGTYFYRLRAENFDATKRLVRLR